VPQNKNRKKINASAPNSDKMLRHGKEIVKKPDKLRITHYCTLFLAALTYTNISRAPLSRKWMIVDL
jgi:hypothetical protein